MMPSETPQPIAWATSTGLTAYQDALAIMEERADRIAAGDAGELVWLIEHPALYTAGTSAKAEHLVDAARLPVHKTGRGGELTYHGPGQRVAYLMLDVRSRFGGDVRGFVKGLEAWVIDALGSLGVTGRTIEGRVGVWVDEAGGDEAKIAALGIRIRRGISLHGISLNVEPDLADYAGIIPCGISDRGVTSLQKLGINARMKDVDKALRAAFERRFGLVFDAPDPRRAVIITTSDR
ncbi:MAG: lipoyl(octanoyl) transferase LipB [Hyphomicrobiaceae bacterium]|nr:lipoyl(octanoyl) transferase LipB [Hyphomicrobiaceae bacterium]